MSSCSEINLTTDETMLNGNNGYFIQLPKYSVPFKWVNYTVNEEYSENIDKNNPAF